jgi:hypothetical protein
MAAVLSTSARATDVGGEVSGTWTPSGNPYVLTDAVYVRKGATLRIEPGVEVRSPQGYPFSVLYKGTLYASGASFTGPEFVRGIGLYISDEDSVDVSNCRFTSYEHGFKFGDNAHPVISGTTVSGCSYPAWYSAGCLPVYLEGNRFAGNEHDVIAVSGISHSDALWGSKVLSEYLMTGSFKIENGSLRLLPGVNVWCADYGTNPQRFFRVGSAYSDQNPRLVAEGVRFYADSTSRGAMIELFYSGGGRSEFTRCEFVGDLRLVDAISCHNSDRVQIANCRFTGLRYGLSISGKARPVIRNCSFTQSVGGILVGSGTGDRWATIEHNCFQDNLDYGINNIDSLSVIIATDNWWGSATGPRHAGDSSGTGDRVSRFVTFSPWLTAEPGCEP